MANKNHLLKHGLNAKSVKVQHNVPQQITSSVLQKRNFIFRFGLKIALKLLKLSAFIFWEMAMSCPFSFLTIFTAKI